MTDPISDITAKVTRHLVPFLMLMFFISLLDRANISFAALQMNKDLSLSPQVYGFAAGVFFIGYVLFEIPSNIALSRFGARAWLGRITITWGVIASSMAWVSGETSLYVLRFMLGVAEAGLLPGIMFYLARWVPGQSRGAILSLIMVMTSTAYVIGAPLSTWLMSFDGLLGFKGWQFMFIVEGIPAILVGLAAFAFLPETPHDASWLTTADCQTLTAAIEQQQYLQSRGRRTTLLDGVVDRHVLLASAFTFFSICDNFGTVFWLPQIISAFGNLTQMQVGGLAAIPYALGGVAMVLVGRRSDRTGARQRYLVTGALLVTLGFGAAAVAPGPVVSFIGICIAAIGIWGTFGVIWAYAADLVSGPAAATGFAVINSVGAIGGFVGPFLIGWVRSQTTSFSSGLGVLAGFGVLTTLLALTLTGPKTQAIDAGIEPEILQSAAKTQ